MTLAIDPNEIDAVLLATGWHEVIDWSFALDGYEYVDGDSGHVLHARGESGVCGTGFSFVDTEGGVMSGPLTAVLAVRRRVRE
jgi:hypothetical protein